MVTISSKGSSRLSGGAILIWGRADKDRLNVTVADSCLFLLPFSCTAACIRNDMNERLFDYLQTMNHKQNLSMYTSRFHLHYRLICSII